MCVCVHVCVYAFAGIFSLFDFLGHGHTLILSFSFISFIPPGKKISMYFAVGNILR